MHGIEEKILHSVFWGSLLFLPPLGLLRGKSSSAQSNAPQLQELQSSKKLQNLKHLRLRSLSVTVHIYIYTCIYVYVYVYLYVYNTTLARLKSPSRCRRCFAISRQFQDTGPSMLFEGPPSSPLELTLFIRKPLSYYMESVVPNRSGRDAVPAEARLRVRREPLPVRRSSILNPGRIQCKQCTPVI